MADKPSLLSPSVYLRQRSLQKGFFGGHRGWMAVGVMVWGPILVKRFLGRNEELIATERLRPGQSIQLDALKPATRRQRKAARRIAAQR